MWEVQTIGARSADVFTPRDRARFLLLFLSDMDAVTLRDNSTWTAILEANRVAAVCPDGGDSWWADRVCPSFDQSQTAVRHLLDDVVPWAKTRFELSDNAIALAGVGAGGQGALRLAFDQPKLFRAVASLGGSLDHYELYGRGTSLDEMYPTREHCRQDGVVLHVQPFTWPPYIWIGCDPDSPWLRGNDRLHEKLMALGAPHTVDFETRVCGHCWSYYDHLAPKLIQFLIEGLSRESRRLM